MCDCGARWGGEHTCHCITCHLTFTTVDCFDAHRHNGRCLTVNRFRKLGYELNALGRWRVAR